MANAQIGSCGNLTSISRASFPIFRIIVTGGPSALAIRAAFLTESIAKRPPKSWTGRPSGLSLGFLEVILTGPPSFGAFMKTVRRRALSTGGFAFEKRRSMISLASVVLLRREKSRNSLPIMRTNSGVVFICLSE